MMIGDIMDTELIAEYRKNIEETLLLAALTAVYRVTHVA